MPQQPEKHRATDLAWLTALMIEVGAGSRSIDIRDDEIVVGVDGIHLTIDIETLGDPGVRADVERALRGRSVERHDATGWQRWMFYSPSW
jgi:hypothetical protein